MTPAGSRSPTISSREGANGELYGGWPMILSGLKTLLETGELLDDPRLAPVLRGVGLMRRIVIRRSPMGPAARRSRPP